MKKKCIQLIMLMILLLVSCGTSNEEENVATIEQSVQKEYPQEKEEAGSEIPLDNQEKETVSFVNIWREDVFLKEQSLSFSQDNSSQHIEYSEVLESDAMNRTLIDILSGKGPDILCVDRENMKNLIENGALGNLDDIILETNRDAILPGAIEIGSTKDGWYGIPKSVSIDTMATSREYWNESSWNISDVQSIVQNNDINSLFVDYTGQDNWWYSLYFLLGKDMESTPFLKNGVAYFDTKEFQDLLALIKNKSGNLTLRSGIKYSAEALNSGDIVGMSCSIFSIEEFGSYRKWIGPNCCFTGYPSETGHGTYLVDQGIIVVNKDSMNKKGVVEFVNFLVSLNTQQLIKKGISIRMDVPEKLWYYDEDMEMYFVIYLDGTRTRLPENNDYSTFLDEYLELIKNAVPRKSYDTDELFDVISEEADAYFSYDKNLKEVTKTIQNRVELYFGERR